MSPAAGSSRWSPTTEQLMILEELYKSGIRTPTASQIQQITTHLSFYGRIEGKNVFYWFQNHKARDRQKMRRKLNKQVQLQQQLQLQQYCHLKHNTSHLFLAGFDSLPESSTQKVSFYNTGLFSQGSAASTPEQAPDFTWRVHNPQSLEEKTEMTFCNYGWRLVDSGDYQGCSCCIRPLKTLDLFPISAARLKEEGTASTKQLFHSMSTN
ncbi:hypothetical protein L6164_003301 [Bauhinia variegata]|uniref:Uncharacterized protein n=1 Tax=Bauhinia variegata TaxID=167791 RepID=A0ACB9Q0W7_BAUVA|nr:hypothetical protein L6164_003301 [Bauhinia variegata]